MESNAIFYPRSLFFYSTKKFRIICVSVGIIVSMSRRSGKDVDPSKKKKHENEFLGSVRISQRVSG
jgi:hypothetical protein